MESAPVSTPEVEAHLERVLESGTFRGAERSARLLRYIVTETLQGRADTLKDYTLGAHALGRGAGFDPRTDPIARVEASRLRSRLDVYYATDGAADEVRIQVPKGGYVPVFERRLVPPAAAPAASVLAAPASATPRLRAIRLGVPIAAGAIAAAVTWWAAGLRPAPALAPETRLELATPATTDPAALALSPDGRTVVYVASDDGVPRLWRRDLGDPTARVIAGTDHATLPFWSPDGRALGFFAEGRVRSVELGTGIVTTRSAAPVPAGGAWNQDDVILHPLVPDSPLFRISARGGTPEPATQLLPGHTGHRGPAFLPGGHRFLFHATGEAGVRGIYAGELGTTQVTRVLDADAPGVFVPPASLLYVQHGTLFARRFDPATLTVSGDPVTIATGIAVEPGSGLAPVAAAANGTIVYRRGAVGSRRQFTWIDRDGTATERIGMVEERGPGYASLAPDGRRLAIQRALDGNTDIWLLDLTRGPAVRLTSSPAPDIVPVWSPRGDRLAFASQVDGVFDLFDTAPDQPAPRLLVHSTEAKQPTDWSRDGRYLLYRALKTVPKADSDIWALPLEGDRTPFPVVQTAFEERDAQFSPDGRWIAYQSNESGAFEIYVQAFPKGGERLRISADGGVQVRWRADGRELFYLMPDGRLAAVPIAGGTAGTTLRPGPPTTLFATRLGAIQGTALHSYTPSPDGQRFLLDALVEQAPPPLSVVVNWTPPR